MATVRTIDSSFRKELDRTYVYFIYMSPFLLETMTACFSVHKNRNLLLFSPHAAASGYVLQQLVYLACS
jgi:hypothetical protein